MNKGPIDSEVLQRLADLETRLSAIEAKDTKKIVTMVEKRDRKVTAEEIVNGCKALMADASTTEQDRDRLLAIIKRYDSGTVITNRSSAFLKSA